MRALVIGASGQVGGAIYDALAAGGHQATGTWRSVAYPEFEQLDLAHTADIDRIMALTDPEAIFCASGATWVDGCEDDPEWARAANVTGPLAVANAAPGVPFVFFSTDYVFDGAAGPYGESDAPNPLSVYGRSKLDGEHALLEAHPGTAIVIRTCGVFGPERQGKNFVYQLWKRLSAGERMWCPSDQYASPAWAPDLARIAIDLVERRASGVFHGGGPDFLSREEFARLGCEVLGLDAGLLDPKVTSELNQKAARPLKGGLRNERLAELGIESPRSARAGLELMRDVLSR
ncbi:MAG: SDR family oxidoreductase [Planctomycetota bacterium]|jgi:dTDP-4-dehydrorhamnose reductase